ncbi:serine/threonine-protein kinase [Planotetraspora thailandica]|uniref:serine/threonine-protein kinase n=1 Tax=Planotetraspora thailandica TaxID=487172 RepID=UPI001950A097|nr:serine/threonine-protein kinase [Planotetraspora thailandica]
MDETGAPLVPGYEVLGVLGQGGFGVVYRARQLAVGREVALKIDNRVLVSERDQRRFMREVTAAGALSGHPHVADVYDAGMLPDGRPYMVLELCPGGSLADRLKEHGPMDAREVRDIGVRIADALAAAHAEGVLHRDVKPANILVNSYGMVALSDFGLATRPGAAAGNEMSVTLESLTPAYAPPEAFELTEPTAAGDVYALSATLYALLYGRPPRFPAGGVVNLAVIMALHRRPIPDIEGVPYELTDVLRRGMATDPRQRTQTAAELRDALAAADLDGPVAEAGGQAPGVSPVDHGGLGRDETSGGAEPSRSTTGPGLLSQAGRPPTVPGGRAGGPRPSMVFGIVAVVFAVMLGAGVTALFLNGPGPSQGSPGGPPGGPPPPDYKVAVTMRNCPASEVPGVVGAQCVAEPECWGGLNIMAGDVTAQAVPCSGPHTWETFAIAPLPLELTTSNEKVVARHPAVAALCTMSTLEKSRTGAAGKITPDRWEVSVMPPSALQFAQGLRVFRCVGTVTGKPLTGSSFAVAG